MANAEHVEMLKQGVDVWNQWRDDNPEIRPDFVGANLADVELESANLSFAFLEEIDFTHKNLSGAKFSNADMRYAKLQGANLTQAKLNNANLNGARMSQAILKDADLSDAILRSVNLDQANLKDAVLTGASLSGASLSYADLSGSVLSNAIFNWTNIDGANFGEATCAATIFTNIDFSTVKGLDTVWHNYPSGIGIDSIFRSAGKIPEIFLRGCGVPETLITFLPSMYEQAIEFYSCFISYSHADRAFAKRLHDRLQGKGIRCWLDEHQLNPGDELHKTIYEGIRVYDKVILCCSETALSSWWVEKEFKNAISKEEDFTETVLIPITLDNYLFEQSADEWAVGEIKRRFVQDFSGWKDHDAFEQAFAKVVKALRTDGGKPPPPTSKLTRRK